MSFKFDKTEHLKSKKSIENLISNGRSFTFFPIKAKWIVLSSNSQTSVKCAFSVPKRNFKKAVERNYIKRIMRESYRLNKNEVLTFFKNNNVQLNLLLTFIGNQKPNFNEIEQKIIITLQHLLKVNEKNFNSNAGFVN